MVLDFISTYQLKRFAMRVAWSVAVLGLSGNKLGDAGVRALSATLPKNATLRSLFLRNNEIGPAGAKSLALVLLSSSNITKINLKNNLLGADGAR